MGAELVRDFALQRVELVFGRPRGGFHLTDRFAQVIVGQGRLTTCLRTFITFKRRADLGATGLSQSMISVLGFKGIHVEAHKDGLPSLGSGRKKRRDKSAGLAESHLDVDRCAD
jgi:hypothetical protein